MSSEHLHRPERAWVFASGDFSLTYLNNHEVAEQDIFVCVDRGLEHCLAAGFQPSVLVGDMDSVSQEALSDSRLTGVRRYQYPRRKAASDLEIALELLCEDPPQQVVLLGTSGGRTDHMLFNWQLPALRRWPFSLQLVDATCQCFVLQETDSINFKSRIGQTISLLPLSISTGVSTVGLQYPLNRAVLSPGSTLGLSNVADSESVQVDVEAGTLLVLVNTELES